jgi:hypothetical protein
VAAVCWMSTRQPWPDPDLATGSVGLSSMAIW